MPRFSNRKCDWDKKLEAALGGVMEGLTFFALEFSVDDLPSKLIWPALGESVQRIVCDVRPRCFR